MVPTGWRCEHPKQVVLAKKSHPFGWLFAGCEELLLGSGSSSVSSGLGSIASSLGSVASGVGCTNSSVGGGGSCTSCCTSSSTGHGTSGSASSGSSFHHRSGSGSSSRRFNHRSGSGCRSGFFLLATSSQGSGSDHGGQYERFIHFNFLDGRIKHFRECHNAQFLSAVVELRTCAI